MALLPADEVADDLPHGGEVRGARRSPAELFAFLLRERAELFERHGVLRKDFILKIPFFISLFFSFASYLYYTTFPYIVNYIYHFSLLSIHCTKKFFKC